MPQVSAPGSPLHTVVSVMGFFFISGIRLAHRVIANRALAGMLSILVGIIPYLLADWLLRRWRRTRAATP